MHTDGKWEQQHNLLLTVIANDLCIERHLDTISLSLVSSV